jgi:hypothetical protein
VEKHTLPIFREKVAMLGSREIIYCRVTGREVEGVGKSQTRNRRKRARPTGSL